MELGHSDLVYTNELQTLFLTAHFIHFDDNYTSICLILS